MTEEDKQAYYEMFKKDPNNVIRDNNVEKLFFKFKHSSEYLQEKSHQKKDEIGQERYSKLNNMSDEDELRALIEPLEIT